MTIREELELVKKELLKWTDVQLNLKNRMDELEAKLEEEESKEQGQDWPQYGDKYYYIDDEGYIDDCSCEDENWDEARKAIGNVFRTEAEAEYEVGRLRILTEMRKTSVKPSNSKPRYIIFYRAETDDVLVTDIYYSLATDIYYESYEKAEKVIKQVGKDNLKKYYFGVVN